MVPIPTVPEVPESTDTLSVVTLAKVAKIFGVDTAFETHTLPATFRVAPPVVPASRPIPTEPEVPKMAAVLVTPTTFMEVSAKTLGVDSAFEIHTLPAMFSVEPEPLVPMPTKPLGP